MAFRNVLNKLMLSSMHVQLRASNLAILTRFFHNFETFVTAKMKFLCGIKLLPSYRCLISSPKRLICGKVGVIGAPFDKGQRKEGAALAPAALRKSGLLTQLTKLDWDVKDYGDIQFKALETDHSHGRISHLKNVSAFNDLLSQQVQQVLKDDRLCITLGGDHSIGLGTVYGNLLANPNMCLLWIDAHPDINTPLTSYSGNMHGMALSFNVKELQDYQPVLPGLDWHKPLLSCKNVAFIGLRDVDPAEKLIIDRFGITALSMDEVHEMGVKEAVKYALSRIDPEARRPIHVSFDIDALDPLEAPSTGTPVRGGLSLREGMSLVQAVFKTNRLSALDLVEVNPKLGSAHDVKLTLEAAQFITSASLGYYSGGKLPKDLLDIPKPDPRS